MTFILGLTGGIATGKTTVSEYFAQKGISIIDADKGARKVVEPGTEGLKKIIQVFGSKMLQEDGTLNRKKLGKLVFANDDKRAILDSLLHPLIREWMHKETNILLEKRKSFVVWDIPLLYEAHYEAECDAVMVVYIPKELQLERLMKRDQSRLEQAENRIKSQLSIEQKKERADIVIDNSGPIESTYRQVEEWLGKNEEFFRE